MQKVLYMRHCLYYKFELNRILLERFPFFEYFISFFIYTSKIHCLDFSVFSLLCKAVYCLLSIFYCFILIENKKGLCKEFFLCVFCFLYKNEEWRERMLHPLKFEMTCRYWCRLSVLRPPSFNNIPQSNPFCEFSLVSGPSHKMLWVTKRINQNWSLRICWKSWSPIFSFLPLRRHPKVNYLYLSTSLQVFIYMHACPQTSTKYKAHCVS